LAFSGNGMGFLNGFRAGERLGTISPLNFFVIASKRQPLRSELLATWLTSYRSPFDGEGVWFQTMSTFL